MPKGGNGGGGGGKPGGGGDNGGTILIKGGNGPDTLTLPPDRTIVNTSFDGGRGTDTLDLSGHSDGVTIKLNNGPGRQSIASTEDFVGTRWDFISLADLPDRVDGSIKNIENIVGTGGNDWLMADDPGTNRLEGGAGNDALSVVGGGGDTLIGGSGEDWILSYSSNLLVGGDFGGGGDGERDIFSLTQGTILDFEIGIDRIMIETNDYAAMDSILAASWTAGTWVDVDGVTRSGAQLEVAPGFVINLANIDPANANTNLTVGFVVATFGAAPVHGGPGDDILYGSNLVDVFEIGPDAGQDMIVNFDTSQDVLSFSGEAPAAGDWVDVSVNGKAAIQWTYDSGASSLTIVGLSTDDVGSLTIQGQPQPLWLDEPLF